MAIKTLGYAKKLNGNKNSRICKKQLRLVGLVETRKYLFGRNPK
jgi:hypothetical protein